jgi:putative hydrolase
MAVSDVPFGFSGGTGGDPDRRPGQPDPFAALFGAGGGPADIGAAFQRLGQLLSWSGGPVNWDLARDLARQAVAASGDRSVGESQRSEVADALRLAELWLDPVTAFAPGATRSAAWSRAEWVEQTMPAWQALVDPLAARVADAMASTISTQLPGMSGGPGAPGAPGMPAIPGLPTDMSALMGPLGGMLRSMGGAMFGAQVGQALGSLAGEVVGSTDVGLPLGPAGTAALLPANVAAFGEGCGPT